MLNFKALKKVLAIFVLILSISFMGSTSHAKELLPKINFVGIEHSPLVVGDSESFYVTSDYEGMVQYRVWISKDNTNLWEDITGGYTKGVDAKTPYVISPDTKFAEGKYKLSVWVKRAGVEGKTKVSTGNYDNYYVASLNCVKKDDNNRVYVNNSMDIEKEEYILGEQVVIKGVNDISGIKGPYKYKLHFFSPSKANSENSGWVKNVTDYDKNIVWTPTEPGIYVLDVHVNTEMSTTWNTYLNRKKENKLDDVYGTYEAWKLKIITVKEKIQEEKEINLNDINKVYGSLSESNPQIMNKDINFLAEGVTLKNINETGNINMLKNTGILENAQVNGNIVITGNNIKLNNVKVIGTIIVNPGNSGVVHLNNVQANEIQILSGATESIHLKDVITPAVIINSDKTVRVETTGKTVIKSVIIKSSVILENDNGSIMKVDISSSENSEVSLKGNYELVNIMKAVKVNVLEGRINKIHTTAPFDLKLGETAYVAELDKNNLVVTISGKDANIAAVKNDTVVVPPVVPPVLPPVTPPVQGNLLQNISIVLDNGEVINATGSQGVLYADISGFSESVKLVHIAIEVTKDCSLNVKYSNIININKTFNLSANQLREITPNELYAGIDTGNDGISIANIKSVLAVGEYFTTTQKLTSGTETMEVVLKVKVK